MLAPSIVERALSSDLQRFDEGILADATSFLAHGIVVPGDAYTPYGPGYGIPGLPLQLILGPEWLATMLSALLAVIVLPALAYAWLRPRVGIPVALGAALVVSLVGAARYAMSWVCVLAMAIAVDALVRRSPDGTLVGAARAHPRAMAAATALLGLAAWVRLEYLVLAVVWIVVAWVGSGLRRRPPWVVLLPPLVVALVPYVVVLVAGGFEHFWWWGHYAAFGFREFRSMPINWDLPVDFVRALFGGEGDLDGLRVAMVSYFGGAIMVLAAVVLLVRRRGVRRDPSMLAPFLVAAGAVVLYAQSVRFHGYNGIQAVGLLVPGFVALGFTARWVRPVTVAALLLLGIVPVLDRINIPGNVDGAREAWRANGSHEPIDHLRRVKLSDEERESLAVLPSLMARFAPGDGPIAVVNRRNDDAQVNESMIYWYLDRDPAIWPVTYDPGLADATPVVSEVLGDLCGRRPPVVQFREAWAVPFGCHGDRRLDPYLALNYRLAGAGNFYRVLVPAPGACRDAAALSAEELHARRDALLRADDLPAAASLAMAVVDRGGRAAPEDALLMLLSTRRMPADELPPGPVGELVGAGQEGEAWPGLPALIADRSQSDLTRMLAMLAFVGGSPSYTDEQKRAVLEEAYGLLGEHRDWPQLGSVVGAFQPPAEPVFDRLEDLGVRATWFERWRFDFRAAAGDERAIPEGRTLLRRYGERFPLDRGAVLEALAPVFAKRGDQGCADAALARADAIPGVDPGPYEGRPTTCAALG